MEVASYENYYCSIILQYFSLFVRDIRRYFGRYFTSFPPPFFLNKKKLRIMFLPQYSKAWGCVVLCLSLMKQVIDTSANVVIIFFLLLRDEVAGLAFYM